MKLIRPLIHQIKTRTTECPISFSLAFVGVGYGGSSGLWYGLKLAETRQRGYYYQPFMGMLLGGATGFISGVYWNISIPFLLITDFVQSEMIQDKKNND
jgi:hypothetical protein